MNAVTARRKPISYRPDLADFERGDIDPALFDHAAHVYIGWLYLQERELSEASAQFTIALRRLTRQLGVPGKYHETISCFFMIVIAERCSGAAAGDWAKFEAENTDLVNDAGTLLKQYYSSSRLASPLAREQFLLPDLLP